MSNGIRQSAVQPALEHAHTAEGPLVQPLPQADEVRFFGNRQLTLEREKHALERQAVLVHVGAVSSEVVLDATSAELRAQVRQPQQFVRADQDVHRTGGRCQRFESIHLVEESTSTRKTLEMLGFVNQADPYAAPAQALFQHPAQRWCDALRLMVGRTASGLTAALTMTLRSSSGSFRATRARA